MAEPRVLVLASGEKEPGKGGSGYLELEEQSRTIPGILNAKLVAVVSNHENGGVRTKNKLFDTPFEFFSKPYTAEKYRFFVEKYRADYVMCSGWLPWIRGLDIRKTINIHPGKIPEFGGTWGHHVHEKALKWFEEGKGNITGVTMHFVDEVNWDHGPQFFFFPVKMRPGEDANKIGSRVNEKERAWQSYILNLVVHDHIRLIRGQLDKWQVVAVQKYTGIIPGFTGIYI
jgi:folate-dependent phosphoribosylglycinamide formyltransferase PurN